MPAPSRRTTSAALQCVFRPTMPYTTWTPARSSVRAHVMLFCSSMRALSSTRAVTCLPFCAARASAEMIGLAPLVRYSVCLMARTWGSSAARSMKSTTHPNDSYGRCTSTSCGRITSNAARAAAEHLARGGGCGLRPGANPPPALAVGRHDHHAVEHGGDLDDGEVAPRLAAVPALDDQGDVEALVVDVWKRVSRVDRERC